MFRLFGDVGEVMAKRRTELVGLLSDSAELAAALDAARADMAGAISGYARVGEVLDRHTADLERILTEGARLGTEGSDLLAGSAHDIEDTLAGLDTTFHNLAIRPTKMQETIYWMPRFAERIGWTLEGDTMNIGLGGAFPRMPGYQPRFGVPVYGEGLRLDKIHVPSPRPAHRRRLRPLHAPGRPHHRPREPRGRQVRQPVDDPPPRDHRQEAGRDRSRVGPSALKPALDEHVDVGHACALLVDGDEHAHPDNLRLPLPAL